ncbi:hypothetical protein RCH16_003197 [Cryobacterium sp. MP_M5]|uniref:DUF4913 domain-containing protein n=1 Tax=unclassified Cryobacterium TaxID=2649013 RepID=UPI001A2A5FB5|nr:MULTISPECIES: DUF4913 domain-containing protein [unclassified Cryobacterium]MBG6059755.1 hypothetical protein [Cryobacterium sp. MP_M3]MEC5178166.1 hypothetical protein [Cryobacterium sp. MP_M5]
MSDGYDDLDDDQDVTEDDESAKPDTLVFGSVDEFFREQLRLTYTRVVGPSNRASRRWSAQWWRSPEAIARLEALWRSWEHLRLDGATGSSTWWRDHLDHHMPLLMSADGPFADSEDQNKPGEPLPYEAPPAGMFPDVRVTPREASGSV